MTDNSVLTPEQVAEMLTADNRARPFTDGGVGGLMSSRGHAYLDDYVLSTDEGADYEPNEFERGLLEDFMAGLLNDEAMFGPVRALLAALEEAEGRLTQVAGNDVWWKTVIGEGETHQQTGEISVKHLHPLTVKPIYEAHKGTVIADVIAGLIFNLAITTNREQFLVSDALDRAQAATARAEKAEQQLRVQTAAAKNVISQCENVEFNLAQHPSASMPHRDVRALADRFAFTLKAALSPVTQEGTDDR